MRHELGAAAGSALLIALAVQPALAADPDWTRAKQIDDVVTEYKFTPSRLVFRAGTAYRLHLANRGREVHEFTAPEFFATVELRDAAPLNVERTEIVLQPGEQKDLYFVARQPGYFRLFCSDHDWAGMTGEIDVK